MRLLDLFSGIGGFSLAAQWVWGDKLEIVAFCEIDPFCQKVLHKHWPNVSIIGDVRDVKAELLAYPKYNGQHEFKGQREVEGLEQFKGWEEESTSSFKPQRSNNRSPLQIDLLTAGVPCQPASCAGKRRGQKDDRWLWPETLRVIREIHPRWCVLENVRGILSLEGGLVFNNLLSELESYGYEIQVFIIPACAINAPHRRDRVWIVAHSKNWKDDGRKRGIMEAKAERREGIDPATDVGSENDGDRYGTGEVCGKSGEGAELSEGENVSLGIKSGLQRRSKLEESEEERAVTPRVRQDPARCDRKEQHVGDPDISRTESISKTGRSRSSTGESGGRLPQSFLGRVVDGIPIGIHGHFDREPDIPRVAKGVPNRVNRLKSLGNAIVPQVAYQIFKAIKETEEIINGKG